MSDSVERLHTGRREQDSESECKYCECGRRLPCQYNLDEEQLEILKESSAKKVYEAKEQRDFREKEEARTKHIWRNGDKYKQCRPCLK